MKKKQGKRDRPTTGGGHDVTEQKSLEVKLRESDQLFRSVFENANDVIYLIDSNGRFVGISPVFEQITGWDPKEWIGRSFETGIHPDDRRRGVDLFHAVLEGQKTSHIDVRVVSKSGNYLDVELNAVPLYQDGSPIVVGFARNITERKRAEETVRESEQKYRTLVTQSPDGIFMVDLSGNFLSVNDSMCRELQFTEKEFLSMNIRDIVPARYEGQIQRRLTRILKREPVKDAAEYEVHAKDGNVHYVEVVSAPYYRGNELIGFQAIARNIDERKAAQEQLRSSEEKYRRLIDNARDAIFSLAPSAIITSLNPAFETITGWNREEWLEKSFADLLHPEDRPRARNMFEQVIQGAQFTPQEFRFATKSGGYVYGEITMTALVVDGRLVGFFGIGRDVTERKRAEEALRASEQFFESIVENIPHMIFVKDARDLKFVRVNRTAESIIGVPREELLGRNDYDFFPKNEADYFVEKDRRVLQSKDILDIPEETLETRNGRRILRTKKISIQGPDGEPRFLLGISEDITERKEMEKKQKALEAQLFRSQRMESLGTLAGGIAHDLNNVLGPIMLSIHVLKERVKDTKSADLLSLVEGSVKRGSEIVKQVLSFARGARGETMLVQLRSLMSDLSRILKETFPRSIQIDVIAPKDIWPIVGDPTQIDQVLMNLSVNARDAMPDGGVLTVSAENVVVQKDSPEVASGLKEGRYVRLRVKDTGIGIPRNIIDRIFDPFFTTKEAGRGTGLGLSTVIAIVRGHDGQVTVSSEAGMGSEFRVLFPASDSTLPEDSRRKNGPLPTGKGELVLLVDDEVAVREIAKDALLSHGYSVITANDGIQALSSYYQNKDRVHVIVSDVMMPFLGGLEVVDAVRKSNAQVKIVLISGLLEEERLERFRSAKGIVILKKPFSTEQLLTAIDDVLHGN